MENPAQQAKVNIDINTLSVLYDHARGFVIPAFVVVVSALLFVFLVIPQFKNYRSLLDQEKIETEKLKTLVQSVNVLNNLDEASLGDDASVLTKALPLEKDFVGVLGSISSSAVKTGVSVGDFQFQVGSLSQQSVVGPFPYMTVDSKLDGSFNLLMDYVSQIYNSTPISETTMIKISANAAAVTSNYFYKPFAQNVISDTTPLTPLSEQEKSLLTTISSWANSALFVPTGINSLGGNNSSQSAQTTVNSSPF